MFSDGVKIYEIYDDIKKIDSLIEYKDRNLNIIFYQEDHFPFFILSGFIFDFPSCCGSKILSNIKSNGMCISDKKIFYKIQEFLKQYFINLIVIVNKESYSKSFESIGFKLINTFINSNTGSRLYTLTWNKKD